VVGPGLRYQKLNRIIAAFVMLAFLPQIGFEFWAVYQVSPRVPPAVDSNSLWLIALFSGLLPILALLFKVFFTLNFRNDTIALIEVSDLDLSEQQIADLLRSQRLGGRITIRHLMVAVALFAVTFGIAVAGIRHLQSRHFRFVAELKQRMAATFRESEERWLRSAVDLEKNGIEAGDFRKFAAEDRAKAGYYDVLQRKYEQAASEGRFIVEPDPPAP
jgi:hypothetical protein